MAQAFVFSDARPLPDSDLTYVMQRRQDGRFAPHLIDQGGNWVSTVDYYEPIFSGDAATGLYPAHSKDGKWGYINTRGDWVVQPQFNGAGPFTNGLAQVSIMRTTLTLGFIDATGKPIPELTLAGPVVVMKDMVVSLTTWYVRNGDTWKKAARTYDFVQPFNDNVLAVSQGGKTMLVDRDGKPLSGESYAAMGLGANNRLAMRDGKWGALDEQGAWLVEPRYEFLATNADGSFRALLHGKPLVLDKSGKLLPEHRYLAIAKPSEGLTAACDGVRCGYVDDSGQWAIPAKFDRTFAFSGGIARAILNGLTVYLDRNGALLTPPPPLNAAALGLQKPSGDSSYPAYRGCIDRDGKYLMVPFYKDLGRFSENLAPATGANDRVGYVNSKGDWIIPPVFAEAHTFSDGWALVRGAGGELPFYGLYAYLDAKGHYQLVLPGSYQSVGGFRNGRARIEDYGKGWFIDKKGEAVPPEPVTKEPPAEQPALQRLSVNGGKWGYADASDRFVIAPRFDEASDFAGGYAAVKIGRLWGYVNRAGKLVVRPAYEEAAPFSEGRARVRKNGYWTFIDERGRTITDDQFSYADDFHDGRASVGLSLEGLRRFAAGISSAKLHHVPPDSSLFAPMPNNVFAPLPYRMLAEGTDLRNGLAAIKLAPRESHALFALMNKQGEIIIPEAMPK